jgi:hypothetical protein
MNRIEMVGALVAACFAAFFFSGYTSNGTMLMFGRDWQDDMPERFAKRLRFERKLALGLGTVFLLIAIVLAVIHG